MGFSAFALGPQPHGFTQVLVSLSKVRNYSFISSTSKSFRKKDL